jgi:hypothetical protein
MTELTPLKTILSPDWPMRCGIAEIHCPSWRICIAPTGQDMRKRLEYLLTEAASVEVFRVWRPVDEDGSMDTQQHCEPRFGGG